MKVYILCILVSLTSVFGCSNEDNPNLSQEDQNKIILQSIANKMGCNVEIELFNHYATEPLEARVIDNYKKIFEQIAELTKCKLNCLLR